MILKLLKTRSRKKKLNRNISFFSFLMILLAMNVNLFLHLFFVIFCLVIEKVVEKRKHGNEFEFAEKGTEKA